MVPQAAELCLALSILPDGRRSSWLLEPALSVCSLFRLLQPREFGLPGHAGAVSPVPSRGSLELVSSKFHMLVKFFLH